MRQEHQSTEFSTSASDRWKADYVAQHQTELSNDLEQMFATPLMQDVASRTLALLALAPGYRVLEVGCGSGVFLPLLAKAVGPAGRVVGIDHSAALVAEAQARLAAAGLSEWAAAEVGDANRLHFPDASFSGAHVERVLMHIDDPSAALREMARVVRPGGWIVAVEPDWAGMRIDHPDRAGFDLLYSRTLTMRQSDMGLTLYRRLREAGLTERIAQPVLTVFTDFEVLRSYGLNLPLAADALVADGALARTHADALLAAVETANATGSFYCVGAYHVLAGRVPM